MFRAKRGRLLILVLFTVYAVHAQPHYNSWFRGTVRFPVSERTFIDAELQHRRQNGYQNASMFDKNLMFTFRTWVQYAASKKVTLFISPGALFSHYRIIQQPADENVHPVRETRFSAGAEFKVPVYNRLFMLYRPAAEYRVFNNSQRNITRVRNRLGLRHEFKQQTSIMLYDELFVNTSGAGSEHFFYHNRIGFNLSYSVRPNIKIDIGYIYINRLPLTGEETLNENNFLLHLTYKLKDNSGNN